MDVSTFIHMRHTVLIPVGMSLHYFWVCKKWIFMENEKHRAKSYIMFPFIYCRLSIYHGDILKDSAHNPTLLMVNYRSLMLAHDDVIIWKLFPRYWPFVRGIHRSTVHSPHKGQWRRALMFSLICVWIDSWVHNREAGDLRRYGIHCDVIVINVVVNSQRTA